MQPEKPWRAQQFSGGYSAEFRPPGQRSFRILKSDGKAVVFTTRSAALDAAENAYLLRVEPPLRSSVEVSPEVKEAKLESKLADEAENWLRSNRRDIKNAETVYRAGKRPLKVMVGRA